MKNKRNPLAIKAPKDHPDLKPWRTRKPSGWNDPDDPSPEYIAYRDEMRERNAASFEYDLARALKLTSPDNGMDLFIWHSISAHSCQRARDNDGKKFSILAPPPSGMPHDEKCDCKTWCCCRLEMIIPGYNDEGHQWIQGAKEAKDSYSASQKCQKQREPMRLFTAIKKIFK